MNRVAEFTAYGSTIDSAQSAGNSMARDAFPHTPKERINIRFGKFQAEQVSMNTKNAVTLWSVEVTVTEMGAL